MNDIQGAYLNSELALASYTNLESNSQISKPSNLDALVDAGLSPKQAEEFAKHYPTVVTQYNDTPTEGGLGTSFSVTVFRDTTGNLTLAFRGTLEGGDFVPTDTDIALFPQEEKRLW